MSRGVIRLGMAFSLLLLSACQMPRDAAKVCADAPDAEKQLCSYRDEMYAKVTANFLDYDHYRGQRCAATLEYSAVNQRYNVIRTQGDEALCLKAWQVIGTAKDLPPPPKNYRQGVMLSFQPGKA